MKFLTYHFDLPLKSMRTPCTPCLCMIYHTLFEITDPNRTSSIILICFAYQFVLFIFTFLRLCLINFVQTDLGLTVSQVGLKLMILLTQTPEYWGYKCVPLCLAHPDLPPSFIV